ncbi:adenosylcobinamide-phosphate synthase CbiB [Deinococcus aquiradiocola]|uniref:Cobalamin biosynthesis protein CobD n=1 Tax=Deinococcus aquiradiocola TaxID=393059 RepID=A0A917UL90_9DEIO|nr:adenosylcobinamide-phosphate synthase CbiB [Deinococcus aquiradiocola]GGJ64944.1 cobalamin biosynthesis protein CobD [Deinococcus aquiradiocola]
MRLPRSSRRVLLLALALDALGEPPTAVHPVAWMGSFLGRARRAWRAVTPGAQLLEGGAGWAAGAALAAGAGTLAGRLPWPLQAAVLKTLLSRRALFAAAGEVCAALEAGNLPGARRLLSWHLVSRDTSDLTAGEVAAAVIESVSENLSDSVVAPTVAYRLGGLPLAAAYRLTNTADAMWGYRTPPLEFAGKVAARADDLLNLLPARVTAGCAVLACVPARLDGAGAWRAWRRDARLTSSPNAGHPMGVFAGALGVRLEKRGVYALNAAGREATVDDVRRALRLARWTLAFAVPLLLVPLPRWPGAGQRQGAGRA